MKTSSVEKDAGAEVLFWRVHIVDELLGSRVDLQRMQYHYIRIKVFDDKGKDKVTTVEIPYRDREAVLNVAGRTIKADGTIVELDPKTVYMRDLVKAGRQSSKVASFAMPAVEAGAIVEYRWAHRYDGDNIMYIRLNFQRDLPVKRVTYFVKPLPYPYAGSYDMYVLPFNCRPTPLKLENDGYNSTYVETLPATRDEPYSPSEPNVKAWALLHYQSGDRKNSEKYWNDIGRKMYQEVKESIRTNDEMKAVAVAATAGGKDNEAKAAALIAEIRKRVRNVFATDVTDSERQKFFKELPKDRRRNAVETFRSGLGTSDDMNVVFAAMAQQAGIEARPVGVPSRSEYLFHPTSTVDDYFLRGIDMAVKVGDTWKLFDVSTKLLPSGMISWHEEGLFALLADPKAPTFIRTPLAPPEASAETRKAGFTLTADGTLEGDVEEAFSGHRAEDSRSELINASADQRQEWLKKRITDMFPDSEATNIKFENVDDPAQVLKVAYHLRAPRYAQVTGRRILVESNPFHRARAPLFSAATRTLNIEFPYAWKEMDDIRIKLPTGWTLDNAEAPGSLNFGEPGAYLVKIMISKDNEVQMSRELTFGNKGMLNFEAKTYPTLKKIFDEIALRDKHSFPLKAVQ